MKKRNWIQHTALFWAIATLGACTTNTTPQTEAAATTPKTQTYEVGGCAFRMIEVEGGSFLMGAQTGDANQHNYDPEAAERETPVTEQQVETFWLGETEVTQGLWKAVMGTHLAWTDSMGIGDSIPVYNVSNDEANTFVAILNDRLKKAGQLDSSHHFCLPTEKEWEYAAKGGKRAERTLYAGSDNADEVGWFDKNSGLHAHNVAQKKPNELGLYDMTGNVWEWCSNLRYNYSTPDEAIKEKTIVIRGGSYGYRAHGARNTCRGYNFGWYKDGDIGFRLCLK